MVWTSLDERLSRMGIGMGMGKLYEGTAENIMESDSVSFAKMNT